MLQLLPHGGSRRDPPRECESTRLFPRSGTQWRHFFGSVFFHEKSGIVYDIRSELFARTVSVGMIWGVVDGRSQ